MNMKNIIFGTGIVVTLTTLGFVLAGRLELTTFGVFNTTVLSILYGWYQKLIKDDIVFQKLKLEDKLNESVRYGTNQKIILEKQISNLKSKLEASTVILPELQKVVESTIEEVKETKPKRKRNTKK